MLRYLYSRSSVIRPKDESQNGCFEKTKHAKFSKKTDFLPPDTHTWVCVSEGKKCLFVGKIDLFCFLETPILRFALLPYYQRGVPLAKDKFWKPVTSDYISGCKTFLFGQLFELAWNVR